MQNLFFSFLDNLAKETGASKSIVEAVKKGYTTLTENEFSLEGKEDIDSDFLSGYLEAMVFCGIDVGDPSGEGSNEFNVEDISPELMKQAISDCEAFQETAGELLAAAYAKNPSYNEEQAGRDFWFTRCGHGVGFWDRDLDDVGNQLADISRAYGNVDPYLGDDELIYCY